MAIAFDNVSPDTFSGANVASLTSGSWAITGSNLLLVGAAASGAASPVGASAMKWGGSAGTALTQRGATVTVGASGRLGLWTLTAPSASTTTLYASWASNQDETCIGGVSYTGVDQTTPIGTTNSNTGVISSGTYTPTVNITSVSADVVVDAMWTVDLGSASIVAGTGQTSRYEVEGAQLTFESMGMSEETATGVTTTMSWDVTSSSSSGDWGTIGVAMKTAATGTGTGWGAPFIGGKRNHLVRVA